MNLLKMNRPIQIQKLMNGGNSDVFVNIVYSLMANLHMSFEEIKKLPIPMAIELMKKLKEEDNRGRRHLN